MNPPKTSKIPRIILSLFFIGIAGFAIFKQQDILDWWVLRDYQAPASISAIAGDTTMSAYGRRLFYVNKPQLQDKPAFYKSCEEGETTIVLGCYKPKQGIYLLDVEDQRLNGVEQVTAAHEMLHAAYDRLDSSQKKEINSKLNAFYQTMDDEQLKSKIELYKKSGADISNELHSILGTEVQTLSPELETYYQQYFSNRKVVSAFALQYQAVFNQRKERLEALDLRLSEIEKEVQTNNSELDRQQTIINAEAKKLEALLNKGLIDEYNAGVADYNKMLVPYKALVAKTKGLIADYKTTLEERNTVAVEAQELNKALDSRIVEEPSANTTL
jgi:hypothetical protein